MCASGLALVSCATPEFHAEPPAARSGFEHTSTPDEVTQFLASLAHAPFADRLQVSSFGTSGEDRPLWLAIAASPMPASPAEVGDRTVVLVNANIHGGEVEGKEAVLQLLGEIGSGAHAALLEDVVLLCVPQFNVDGDAARDPRERVAQNGPEVVGHRPNAAGLDLNRDFIKLESPEVRALTGLFREWDPTLLMDLHATNGTHHGYHLTYAPSLSPNVDPAIDGFCRDVLLAGARERLDQDGIRVFDYGNSGNDAPYVWRTYDHRPRFGTNLYGLRNRFSVLSEAYVYLDFAERVRVTHAFVLEILTITAERGDDMRRICREADERAVAGGLRFGYDTRLAPKVPFDLLLGEVREVPVGDLGVRVEAVDRIRSETAHAQVAFESTSFTDLPFAWIIPLEEQDLLDRLHAHGVRVERWSSSDALKRYPKQVFWITEVDRSPRAFQGHHEVRCRGTWSGGQSWCRPNSMQYVVRSGQPLGRLAAQLLEPQSEDSLVTWSVIQVEDPTEHGISQTPPFSICGLLLDGIGPDDVFELVDSPD
tara:strand:+ start:9613 stop:11226 length:1614 start_codon:yes stop_codon:yes gene_type:complete